ILILFVSIYIMNRMASRLGRGQQQQQQRPNYFFGLKITNQLINAQLKDVQDRLSVRVPGIKRSLTSSDKFHLTVFVMTLKDPATELPIVKSLMSQAKTLMNEAYNNTPSKVTVSGIRSFSDRVLFAGLKQDDDNVSLGKFAASLTKLFQDNKIDLEDRWSPHITLAKGRGGPEFTAAINDCAPYANTEYGVQMFASMDLMRIGSTDPITRYYEVTDTVQL
ncbi:hypothetical protein SAMD00019534_035240, partial [Acytostelium subglobosum LB1]|uniref:hypothetical protein n=1 Tax=Acytostelium subglobosum LB1 TaxID=1410327 RepID=UPI000644D4C5